MSRSADGLVECKLVQRNAALTDRQAARLLATVEGRKLSSLVEIAAYGRSLRNWKVCQPARWRA
jgi:hypothetical protein